MKIILFYSFILLLFISYCFTNDCPDATILNIPNLITGSTSSEVISTVSPNCFSTTSDTRNAWFSISPPQGTFVTISTCGSCFDTTLSVYKSDCENLSCFLSNDDTEQPCSGFQCEEFSILSSFVSFCASGEEYKILVKGYGSSYGDFQLNIDTSSCAIPDNDICSNAQQVSSLPSIINFSNQFASGGSVSCGIASENDHSIWYKVIGTGGTMIANTCNSDTDFPTTIGIFSGSCGSLECIVGNKANSVLCPSFGLSYVEWCSDIGTEYLVFVSGADSGFGSGSISFEEGPQNCTVGEAGRCTNPHNIELDANGEFSLSGHTVVDSSSAVDLPNCDTSTMSKDTIEWFVWQGNGRNIRIRSCDSDFDTVINVFSGSCFDLSCVLWNDDFCGLQSDISFCSKEDVIYYIALGGYGLSTGNYNFFVNDFGACLQGSTCEDVPGVLSLPTYTHGDLSYLNSEPLLIDTCGSAPVGTQNAWFTVVGESIEILLSTCDSCVDTVISVYESLNGCDELRCVTYNDDHNGECSVGGYNACDDNNFSSAVSFCGGNGITYYILVSGYGGEVGPLTLIFDYGYFCLSNDDCDLAEPINLDEEIFLDTWYGFDSSSLFCDNSEGAGSAWFLLEGNGGLISISSTSTIETSILVFTSESGTCIRKPEVCLEGEILQESSMVFCTKAGQKYWISVGGTDNYYGFLSFIASSVGGCFDVENQVCNQREVLDISNNPTLIQKSTIYAGGEDIFFSCFGINFYSPSFVWYSIIGNGKNVQVSLCNSDYDTTVAILEASCDFKTCVASNDDSCGRQSYVEFCGLKDIEYMILVAGYAADSGNYELLVNENGFCQGSDVCSGSDYFSIPAFITGSNLDTPSSVDIIRYQVPLDCLSETDFINTQWYRFISDDARMIFIDGYSYSSIPLTIGAYFSDCVSTECAYGVDSDYDIYSSDIFVCGDFENEMYLMVAGVDDARGDYALDIFYTISTCSNVDQVVTCEDAHIIPQLPHYIFGDTREGIPFFDSPCINEYYPLETIMVGQNWFSIIGNSYNIQINACDISDDLGLHFTIFKDSCNPNQCIASNINNECSLSFCGIPETQYYIKMGTINATISAPYKLEITEQEICAAPPYSPFVYIDSKDTTSITFIWETPFSYGFPVLSYSYTLFDKDYNEIFNDTVIGNTITLTDLDEDTFYFFSISAINEWGESIASVIYVKTPEGECFPNLINIEDAVKEYEYYGQIRGNILTPSSHGIINSVEFQVGDIDSNPVYLFLYENNYNQDQYFIEKSILKINGNPSNSGHNLIYYNLGWEICSNKEYIIASLTSGEVYQSPNETNISTCFGEMKGISVDAFFFDLFRDSIWYNNVIDTNFYQMTLDVDILPIENEPPSSVEILTYYSTVTSITIEWEEPCSVSPIISYKVQINPQFEEIILSNSERDYTFSGLVSDGIYDIKISAINEFGESEITSQEIRTIKDRYSVQWLSQSGSDISVGRTQPIQTAFDTDGNSYVVGFFTGLCVFGNYSIEAPEFVRDSFLVKYNTIGEVEWLIHIGRSSIGYTSIWDVAVDSNNNVYITGEFVDSVILADNVDPIRTNIPGSTNVIVAKYSSNGDFIFSKHMGDDIGFDHGGYAITIDSLDRFIVTGYFNGFVYLTFYDDNEYKLVGVGDQDLYVSIWSSTGELEHAVAIVGEDKYDDIFGLELCVDVQNNIYIVGYYNGKLIAENRILDDNGNNFFVVKYTPDLELQWLNGFGGDDGFNYGRTIKVDSDLGIVVVGGDFETISFVLYPSYIDTPEDPIELIYGYNNAPIVMGLSVENGSVIWTNTISIFSFDAFVESLIITDNHVVITTGQYSGFSNFGDDYIGIPFPPTQYYTAFFISFDVQTGTLGWARWAGSQFYDQIGRGIDVYGNIVTGVGYFEGSASFDCSSTTTAMDLEGYIVQLLSSTDVIDMDNGDTETFICDSEILTDETGNIKFPSSSSSPYPNNFDCFWLIQIDNVPHIMAILNSFDLADIGDSLTIYDGDSVDAPILHYYNGDNAISNDETILFYDNYYNRDEIMIQSTGPSLLIHFKTGGCFRGVGFELNYESAPNPSFCDPEFEQTVTLPKGLISQSQKGGYKDSSDCFFYIKPPSSKYVYAEFLEFELADNDFVEFIDETGVTSEILGRFYGNNKTFPIQSYGSFLTVHFVADTSLYDRGFIISYTGIDEGIFCLPEKQIFQDNGFITSIPSNNELYIPTSLCEWIIESDSSLYDSIYLYFNTYDVSYPGFVTLNLEEEGNSVLVSDSNELFISDHPSIGIHFNANGGRGQGFSGEFCSHPKHGICQHSIFTNLTASFNNHFCGLYYEANSFCDWTFAPETSSNIDYIMVTFPFVDLVNNDVLSPTDYIDIQELRNGFPISIGQISESKLQNQDPPTFIVSTERVKIIFNSDDKGFGKGFDALACANIKGETFECSESELSAPQGTFNNYFCGNIHSANANCSWRIVEKEEQIIGVMLIFNNLNFADEEWDGEQWYDNIIVYENSEPVKVYNRGGSHDGKSLSSSQETGDPIDNPEILSFTQQLPVHITFESNNIGFTNGFLGSYCLFTENDDRLCSNGEIYRDISRVFNNHACDVFYEPNADCAIEIIPAVQSEFDIVLYIYSIDFVNTGDTLTDTLKIYDGGNINDQFLIGAFNKSKEYYENEASEIEASFPKSLIATRNQMIIKFNSDDIGFGEGYDAEYCTLPKPASTCGGGIIYTENYAYIKDHNCGKTYYSPMNCMWDFNPSLQNFTYIALVFHKLDLGEGARIEVYDPSDNFIYRSDDHLENTILGTRIFEGSALFIQSTTSYLQFIVDSNAILKSGWEIEYLTVDDTGICSGENIYTDEQGFIQPYTLGNFYSNNMECNFLIQIPSANSITVRFEYFNLEEGYDFLEIYDGDGWNSELIGFISGNETPLPFTSSSNSLYFTFRSDETIVERGFKIYYSDSDLVDCPLFCSGFGSCINNTCECVEGRYGSGCEILPAPEPIEARFTDTLDTIEITFDRETNRAGMFGSLSTDCSILLSDNTISKLGSNPRCIWYTNSILLLKFGNNPTINIDDIIELKGNILQEINPTDEYPFAESSNIIVSPPRDPLSPVSVIIGPTSLQNGRSLTLDASASFISGGRQLYYIWSITKVCFSNTNDCVPPGIELEGYVSSQHGEILFINPNLFNDYEDDLRFHFTCIGVNFLNMFSMETEHTVQRVPTAIPMTVIAGPSVHQINRDENLFIRAYIEVSDENFDRIIEEDSCPSVEFKWTLVCKSEACFDDIIPFPSGITSDKSDIYIPGNTLGFNTVYQLQLETSYIEPDSGVLLETFEFVDIDVLPFAVDIEVLGGIQIFSLSSDITIDAQVNQKQQDLAEFITYRWACRTENGFLCQKLDHTFLELEDTSSITISHDTLPPGDYIFSVIGTFSDGNIVSKDRENVDVRILRRDQPIVKILRPNGYGKHDSRKLLVLQADAELSVDSYSWSVSAGDLVLSSDNILSETTTGNELVIANNILLDGATYRFRVDVTAPGKNPNYAEIEIIVNGSPSAALLSISPSFGISIETKFTFAVDGASDDKTDMPLRYVFGVLPLSCNESSKLPDGSCPIMPISNESKYPRFNALLPAGEYYPVVDIFDRFGSYRRVIASNTVASYDTCPITPDLMTEYIEYIAILGRAYNCLSDFDTVRQLVNIASVSLSCPDFTIPEEALEIYFNELGTLINQINSETQSTEIYNDNKLKSLFLSSFLPLNGYQSNIGSLLSNSNDIASSASINGFLRSDSAQSLLNAISNFMDNPINAADVTNLVNTITGIAGGQLLDRTCDTTANLLQSTNIQMQNKRQSGSTLAGSTLEAAPNSAAFSIPSNAQLSNCINYIVVNYDINSFDDGQSQVIGLPAALSLTDVNNNNVNWGNEPIQIRIPRESSGSSNDTYNCASWNEDLGEWSKDCTFIGEEGNNFIMETTHLTNFAVLLGGGGGSGGPGTPSISSFGSFASEFTGATELFGNSNLDQYGNLLSSFTALSDIPTEAFDTSDSIYDILQYSYSSSDIDEWTIDRILAIAFTGGAIICIIFAMAILSIPAVRDRVSGKAGRTSRIKERAEERRKQELETLPGAVDSSIN